MALYVISVARSARDYGASFIYSFTQALRRLDGIEPSSAAGSCGPKICHGGALYRNIIILYDYYLLDTAANRTHMTHVI